MLFYLKIFLTLPYFLLILRKGRSWRKKIYKDPNLVSEEKRYYWLRRMARLALWYANGKVVGHNMENWVDNGCLLVGNHQSNFDGFGIFALNDFEKQAPVAFIGKKSLLKHPIMRNMLLLIDVIFLDRKNLRDAVRVIQEANELIRVPRAMVLFPEGTRSQGPNMQQFKNSFLKIAQKSYVPIVPFAIVDSYKASHTSMRKNYIHYFFLKPLKPQSFLHSKTDFLGNKIKTSIQKILDQYQNMTYQESKKLYKQTKKQQAKAKKQN